MLVAVLVVSYSLCSSMLLILNKVRAKAVLAHRLAAIDACSCIPPELTSLPALQVAVTYIPAPSFILFCQLASCAAYVKLSAMAGFLEAEGLEWEKSKKFALIVFGFIGTLFSNVTSLRVSTPPAELPLNPCTAYAIPQVLEVVLISLVFETGAFSNVQYVPVDTIICFRASCPLVIAVIEYFYLDRELPSLRSWASLIGEHFCPDILPLTLIYTNNALAVLYNKADIEEEPCGPPLPSLGILGKSEVCVADMVSCLQVCLSE